MKIVYNSSGIPIFNIPNPSKSLCENLSKLKEIQHLVKNIEEKEIEIAEFIFKQIEEDVKKLNNAQIEILKLLNDDLKSVSASQLLDLKIGAHHIIQYLTQNKNNYGIKEGFDLDFEDGRWVLITRSKNCNNNFKIDLYKLFDIQTIINIISAIEIDCVLRKGREDQREAEKFSREQGFWGTIHNVIFK